MADGPGKYDRECQELLIRLHASTTVLMVIEGDRGNGFSVVSTDPNTNVNLPKALRDMADQIEGVS